MKKSPVLLRSFLILFILLYSSILMAGQSKHVSKYYGLGVTLARTNFSINQTLNIAGENTHFFTGERQYRDYLGFYFQVQALRQSRNHFGLSSKIGLGWWQAGYILNWEIPYYGISLEPIDAYTQLIYLDLGVGPYIRIGFLRIVPFLSIPIGFSNITIEVGGSEETGAVFFTGLSGNLELQLSLSKYISLNSGLSATMPLSSTSKYEVEEDVKIEGTHKKMPIVFYMGVSIKVNK